MNIGNQPPTGYDPHRPPFQPHPANNVPGSVPRPPIQPTQGKLKQKKSGHLYTYSV